MSNEKIKVFIDSSILVEFKKQSKTDLLLQLLAESKFQLFINPIVLSEYTYYLLAIEGNKSPRSVKEAAEIENI